MQSACKVVGWLFSAFVACSRPAKVVQVASRLRWLCSWLPIYVVGLVTNQNNYVASCQLAISSGWLLAGYVIWLAGCVVLLAGYVAAQLACYVVAYAASCSWVAAWLWGQKIDQLGWLASDWLLHGFIPMRLIYYIEIECLVPQ